MRTGRLDRRRQLAGKLDRRRQLAGRLDGRRQPTDQTVHPATARGPNCAYGDSPRPETAHGCRRMHSLSRGVSPDAQFGTPVVARCTVWSRAVVMHAARPRARDARLTSHSRTERIGRSERQRVILSGASEANGVEGSRARRRPLCGCSRGFSSSGLAKFREIERMRWSEGPISFDLC